LLHILSIETRAATSAVRFFGEKTAGISMLAEVVIKVEDPMMRLSSEQVSVLLAANPTLAEHACRQQGIGRFGDKIHNASLPHIVEHLAIDYLVNELGQPVTGNTVWHDRSANIMLIRLGFAGIEQEDGRLLVKSQTEVAVFEAVAELENLIQNKQ
jgi:hypothetical protein